MQVNEIQNLIAKDIRLELKQRYAFNGIILYVISTIFVTYLSFQGTLDKQAWNALFWIIMLFAGVNAVSKSFVQESISRQLYYYTLARPQSIILSKILYNFLLMAVISLFCLVVFVGLMGGLILNYPLFVICLLLGSFGFSSTLTLVAAIASRTNNNFALMAIMGFPIVMPLLLTLMKVSAVSLNTESWAGVSQYIIALALINGIVIALSYVLFPYLWRD